ncbi:MAG: hypothetical protein AAF196_06190 [Planctomycetota bacterium]
MTRPRTLHIHDWLVREARGRGGDLQQSYARAACERIRHLEEELERAKMAGAEPTLDELVSMVRGKK